MKPLHALLGAACTLVLAQGAQAGRVIVDVFEGTSPARVAARHRIVVEHVSTEVANAFVAEVTARQVASLEADPDVRRVAADGMVGRIPRPNPRLVTLAAKPSGQPPTSIPAQPAQFVTAAMRRVRANASATAAIDGADDRRVNADIARDGHGTLVAGFAAAIDNGTGLVGVAPGARI